MHELSIATAVLNTALKHAEERPVTRVHVRTGAMRQVVPQSLHFYFEIVARDTLCEGAELDLVQVDARLACDDCGWSWEPEIPAFLCPQCGSQEVRIVAGDELQVEYIEVQAEEAACTAPR
ncbi:MAG: hydrogenase maturation nickel metallochaperone HypA [Solirubrobacteraceae bacterium]